VRTPCYLRRRVPNVWELLQARNFEIVVYRPSFAACARGRRQAGIGPRLVREDERSHFHSVSGRGRSRIRELVSRELDVVISLYAVLRLERRGPGLGEFTAVVEVYVRVATCLRCRCL